MDVSNDAAGEILEGTAGKSMELAMVVVP